MPTTDGVPAPHDQHRDEPDPEEEKQQLTPVTVSSPDDDDDDDDIAYVSDHSVDV